jgi:TATA-binding protein-associated factor
MDSDQILDIFTTDEAKKKNVVSSDKKMSTKEVLDGLEELWEESQYEDLSVDKFMETVKNK